MLMSSSSSPWLDGRVEALGNPDAGGSGTGLASGEGGVCACCGDEGIEKVTMQGAPTAPWSKWVRERPGQDVGGGGTFTPPKARHRGPPPNPVVAS